MPNLTFDTLDTVPEGLKEYAKQADGKFVVNVVPEVKLAEFRDNNVRLSQERDGLATVLGKLKPVVGDDVDAFVAGYGELATTVQRVKDGKLKTTDDIEAEVQNRVATMKTGFETQNAKLAHDLAVAQQVAVQSDAKFKRSIVERSVTDAVINEKSGALPSALPDILSRAYGVFQVGGDDKLVAKDGEAIIYGADGATPMTPLEWMTKLREQAPYLFKNSNGGGASNGTNGSINGMTLDQIRKLSPLEKMALGREQNNAKRAVK